MDDNTRATVIAVFATVVIGVLAYLMTTVEIASIWKLAFFALCLICLAGIGVPGKPKT